jgi:hypothetical protein
LTDKIHHNSINNSRHSNHRTPFRHVSLWIKRNDISVDLISSFLFKNNLIHVIHDDCCTGAIQRTASIIQTFLPLSLDK